LLAGYASVLGHSLVAGALSLGLYVPSPGNSATLMRTAELRRGLGSSEREMPGSLSLRSDNTLNRHAFWGKIQLVTGDGADPGFMPGERAVIMVPIRQFGRESEATWGLIRIAIYTESDARALRRCATRRN